MRWALMSVVCAPEAVDAVSYAFLEAGCGGVMLKGSNLVTVEGSLPVSDALMPSVHALVEHLDRLPEFDLPPLQKRLTLSYAEDEDWANAWKQYFKPLRVGNRIVIVPEWETYEAAPQDLEIALNPGMAFGTGTHPTTQLCLLALEQYVQAGMTVADVGTGSGILSLAAAKLGASTVLATDIDTLPRRIARENVTLNRLDAIVHILEMDAFDAQVKECDLIVANIVANTIVELAPSLAPRIKTGGIFLASGIVEEHHDLVRDALADVGLEHRETKRDDIWVCLISQKTSDPRPQPHALHQAARELPPRGSDWSIGD